MTNAPGYQHDFLSPTAAMNALETLFQTEAAADAALSGILHLDDDVFRERVEAVGSKIDTPKTRIGAGHLATFVDSEGNTVGLLEWDGAEEAEAAE